MGACGQAKVEKVARQPTTKFEIKRTKDGPTIVEREVAKGTRDGTEH